jgi:hypothetical protein
VVADDEAGIVVFLEGPRWRKAAFSHVTIPCRQVKQLFAIVSQRTFGSIINNVEGYQNGGTHMRARRKTKTDLIGG